MAEPAAGSSAALEQFIVLAKSARGGSVASLISQALEKPGLYVFAELIDMEAVAGLEGTEHAPALELLKLFAYGVWADYKARARAHALHAHCTPPTVQTHTRAGRRALRRCRH